jgi:flagellar hook-basal body complex protein FliE
MEGFTVNNSNRFLESGSFRDSFGSKVQSNPATKANVTGGEINPSAGVNGPSFSDTLKDAINKVNDLQVNANKQAEMLATGRTDNVADVMLASEKADIALRLMMQVRNKMIDAYQEVMRMQV